jgi:hypothetical protein
MPHYRVAIDGDGQRAMGLLAKAGIQNLAETRHWIDAPDPHGVTARLSAETSIAALRRVMDALGAEFTVRRDVWREASGDEPGRVEFQGGPPCPSRARERLLLSREAEVVPFAPRASVEN